MDSIQILKDLCTPYISNQNQLDAIIKDIKELKYK